MKQHLDTIPIWDAFKENSECPLCAIRERNEASYVDNFLGGSVMEPATRVEVNQKGFCARHFSKLYDAGNRLGLALMTHTYLKETIARAEANAEEILRGASARAPLFRRAAASGSPAEAARALSEGCILCERLDDTMERYALTLLYMWGRETSFREAFAASKGLCLPHYAQLLRLAPEELSGAQLKTFGETLTRVEKENLDRLEKEIEWFTLKFDYRNADKPWGTSQDSVERALNKLRGRCI